jgi:hypothetical protein
MRLDIHLTVHVPEMEALGDRLMADVAAVAQRLTMGMDDVRRELHVLTMQLMSSGGTTPPGGSQTTE